MHSLQSWPQTQQAPPTGIYPPGHSETHIDGVDKSRPFLLDAENKNQPGAHLLQFEGSRKQSRQFAIQGLVYGKFMKREHSRCSV